MSPSHRPAHEWSPGTTGSICSTAEQTAARASASGSTPERKLVIHRLAVARDDGADADEDDDEDDEDDDDEDEDEDEDDGGAGGCRTSPISRCMRI